MKRIILVALSAVIILSGLTVGYADNSSSNKIISFDGNNTKVYIDDTEAILYTAAYETDGVLKSVEICKFNKKGENSVTLKKTADKAMLWDKNMKPYDMKIANKIEDTKEISLDKTSYPLYVGTSSRSDFSKWEDQGSSVNITASLHNSQYSEKDIIWDISDDTVAYEKSTDKNRIEVQGKRTGITEVVATLPNGETASCSISVIDNAARLTIQRMEFNTNALNLSIGQTAKLTPIFYPKDIYNLGILNTSLSWQSSDTAVATVDNNGNVTAVGNGAAEITATSTDVGRTAKCSVTVKDGIVQNEVTTNTDIIDMTVGESKTLSADGEIIWKSDNSYIADVDENGIVTAYSNSNVQNVSADGLTVTETAGTVKIYATDKNGGKTAEYQIRVASSDIADEYLKPSDGVFGKAKYITTNKTTSLSIDETEEIDIDEVYQLNPTSDGDSKILWINTNHNIATLDREGNLQGYKSGVVKAYAVTEDSLTSEQLTLVKALQENRENAEEDILSAINGAVYDVCAVTVRESSPYLRNTHIVNEAITYNSVNVLWNRAALNNIPDFKEYKVYINGTEIDAETTLGYTFENLEAETEYTFKVSAVDTNGNELISETVNAKTKAMPTVILNVLDYGAKGDDTVLDTYAIQKAINECPKGGMVYLPSGYVFRSGALFLKSDMTFKVDGILLGSIDPKDYPRWVTKWEGWRKTEQSAEEWDNTTSALPENHMPHTSLINAGKYDEGVWGTTGPYNVENLVICGSGQINANGFALGFNEGPNATYSTEPWTQYNYPVKDPTQRGRAVTIHNGRNIYIKDITIAYSPSWTTHFIYCDNVTIDNAQIVSQGNGNGGKGTSVKNAAHIPNGDGIDPESCTNLNVFNTHMSTGDDSFTMKSGRNREGNELDKPNAYIRVTDCITAFALGGYGYGSENAAGTHDVLFQNITVDTVALNGFWFKTNKARGGVNENIQVRDSYVTSANSVVYANHTYVSSTTNAASSLPVLRYMTFENVNGGSNSNGFKFEGIRGSDICGVTIIGGSMNNKPSSVKYGKDFTILDCADTVWSTDSSSNINILSTAILEDTKLSVKEGAYKIKEIDNENCVIYAYKGTSVDEVLAGIESLLGGNQTYKLSNNTIEVFAQDVEHSAVYIIDLSSDIPNDAYINSLNIKSGDKELLKNFNRDITEYSIKSAKEKSVVITPFTNDINASVNITNNGMEFDGTLTDGVNEIEITVMSSDSSDTKTYNVEIDNSYIIAEDFSSVSDDTWEFSGGNNSSVSATEVANASDIESETLKLLTASKSGSNLSKIFSDDISSLKNIDIQFDWKSNMNSSKGRWGYFSLQDSEGNYIFSMYANDKNSIGYAMINPTENSAITNIAKFSRAWYTVSLSLDFENKTVKGTVTERDTGKIMAKIDAVLSASNLGKMYAYDGYSATPMSIDNIYIK